MCQGPGNNQVDLSFYKNFKLTEKLQLQFRMEFFNAFNHTQFKSVDTDFNASDLALDDPTTNADGDAINATRIISSTPGSTFGQAQSTRGPREIQYGLKLIF